MNAQWLLLVAVGLFTGMGVPQEKGVKDELKKLQGVWVAVSVENDGLEQPKETIAKAMLTIRGERFTIQEDDFRVEGTLQVDPAKEPKTFDGKVAWELGEIISVLGIFKLEGDTLTICYDVAPRSRPITFKTTPESGTSRIVWKRAKP